jgi:hypothetical protein
VPLGQNVIVTGNDEDEMSGPDFCLMHIIARIPKRREGGHAQEKIHEERNGIF